MLDPISIIVVVMIVSFAALPLTLIKFNGVSTLDRLRAHKRMPQIKRIVALILLVALLYALIFHADLMLEMQPRP